MKMKMNQISSHRLGRFCISFTLLLIFLVCCSQATFAQWLTNGANINNTNTGNVGIGTTAPGAALDVVNSTAAGTGTARFKNTNANTQVIIDSALSQNTNLRFDNNALPFWYVGNEATNNRFRILNGNANGN